MHTVTLMPAQLRFEVQHSLEMFYMQKERQTRQLCSDTITRLMGKKLLFYRRRNKKKQLINMTALRLTKSHRSCCDVKYGSVWLSSQSTAAKSNKESGGEKTTARRQTISSRRLSRSQSDFSLIHPLVEREASKAEKNIILIKKKKRRNRSLQRLCLLSKCECDMRRQ